MAMTQLFAGMIFSSGHDSGRFPAVEGALGLDVNIVQNKYEPCSLFVQHELYYGWVGYDIALSVDLGIDFALG